MHICLANNYIINANINNTSNETVVGWLLTVKVVLHYSRKLDRETSAVAGGRLHSPLLMGWKQVQAQVCCFNLFQVIHSTQEEAYY